MLERREFKFVEKFETLSLDPSGSHSALSPHYGRVCLSLFLDESLSSGYICKETIKDVSAHIILAPQHLERIQRNEILIRI